MLRQYLLPWQLLQVLAMWVRAHICSSSSHQGVLKAVLQEPGVRATKSYSLTEGDVPASSKERSKGQILCMVILCVLAKDC